MKIHNAINYICYAKNPMIAPNGINQLRWNAILKYVKNNWNNIKMAIDN